MTSEVRARLREEARSTPYRALAKKYGLTLVALRAVLYAREETTALAVVPEMTPPGVIPEGELNELLLQSPRGRLLQSLGLGEDEALQALPSYKLYRWMMEGPEADFDARLDEARPVIDALAVGALLDATFQSHDPKAKVKAAEVLLKTTGRMKGDTAQQNNTQVLQILQAPLPGPTIVFPDEVDLPDQPGNTPPKE